MGWSDVIIWPVIGHYDVWQFILGRPTHLPSLPQTGVTGIWSHSDGQTENKIINFWDFDFIAWLDNIKPFLRQIGFKKNILN